jgi:hypothetical protein
MAQLDSLTKRGMAWVLSIKDFRRILAQKALMCPEDIVLMGVASTPGVRGADQIVNGQ